MSQTTKYFKTLLNAIIGKTHKDIEGLLDYIDDIHAEFEYLTHRLDSSEKLVTELTKKKAPVKKATVKKTAPKKTSGK